MTKAEETIASAYHHGDVRNACLLAAMDIIREKGMHQLNLRAVARAVGISHNTPYRAFQNKEDMMAAVTVLIYRDLQARILPVIAQAGTNQGAAFYQLAKAFYGFAVEQKELYRVLSGYLIADYSKYPELKTCVSENFEIIHQLVKGYLQENQDSKKIVTMCIATLHGFCSLAIEGRLELLYPDLQDADEMLEFITQQLTYLSKINQPE